MIRTRERSRGGAPSGDGTIKDILSGAVFELQASDVLCDSGSDTTVHNLIKAPFDGLAQTDWDFWKGTASGADAKDPTFTGTPGAPGAYWLCDGGDQFFSAYGGTTQPWLQRLVRTDEPHVFMAWFVGQVPNAGITQHLMGYNAIGTTTGWRFSVTTSGVMQVNIANSTSGFNTTYGTAGDVPWDTPFFTAMVIDTVAQTLKFVIDGTSFGSKALTAYTCTTDATTSMGIATAVQAASNMIGNTGRVYACGMSDGDCSDAQLAQIATYLTARTGVAIP